MNRAIEDVIDARFRIVRELGRGGMGAVYAVEHLLTGHVRALKLIDAQTPNGVQRIVREASAAARIVSPHIVSTLDAGFLPEGGAYILMELLEGESLADLWRRAAPLDKALACALGVQVCIGLEAAHRAGVVHRDIKPGNLFVTGLPEQPFVKIIDFGISHFDPRITDMTEITREGVALGTLSYMAPEQLRGDRTIDGRADVYSLGIVLYMLLTNRRPFGSTSVAELAIAIDRGAYERLDQVRPDLPAWLVDAIHAAMSPDASARPDAATFGRRLAAAGAPETSEATPFPHGMDTVSIVTEPRRRGHAARYAAVGAALLATAGVALGVAAREGRTERPVGLAATATATTASSAPEASSDGPLLGAPPIVAPASASAPSAPASALAPVVPVSSSAAPRPSSSSRSPSPPGPLDRHNPYSR